MQYEIQYKNEFLSNKTIVSFQKRINVELCFNK